MEKIITTEAKAKEIRKVAEKLIALAVKEKDNFETVTVDAKVAKKDENGKRVKEVVDGKKVTVYETSSERNRTSEHRSMYSYVRLSIDRCTATYV